MRQSLKTLVVDNANKAKKALDGAALSYSEADVLHMHIELPNLPGALRGFAGKLASKKINFTSGYATVAKGAKKATVVLAVSHLDKAASGPVGARNSSGSYRKAEVFKMNRKDLDPYRQLPLAKRREIEAGAMGMIGAAGGAAETSGRCRRPGDRCGPGGSPSPLAPGRRRLLPAIEDALARIDRHTFGVCQSCKRPISPARSTARSDLCACRSWLIVYLTELCKQHNSTRSTRANGLKTNDKAQALSELHQALRLASSQPEVYPSLLISFLQERDCLAALEVWTRMTELSFGEASIQGQRVPSRSSQLRRDPHDR
jgi:hypothetical protein